MARAYHSKVLLFGEYTVVKGSRALAIPYQTFSGRWYQGNDQQPEEYRQSLLDFAGYLNKLQSKGELLCQLDADAFQREVSGGLLFVSDIPTGYGLGSSGALCAAVYDRYAAAPIDRNDESAYPDLRRTLARMESFFHGSSSGTDPVISYIDHPILIENNGNIRKAGLPARIPSSLFLFNTGIPRKTGPLVEIFLQNCKSNRYLQLIESELVPANENAIDAFLNARWEDLGRYFRQISEFQLHHMGEMIPDELYQFWKQGLDGDVYCLKLCGAGGGGFLLGLTYDLKKTKRLLKGYDWSLIHF